MEQSEQSIVRKKRKVGYKNRPPNESTTVSFAVGICPQNGNCSLVASKDTQKQTQKVQNERVWMWLCERHSTTPPPPSQLSKEKKRKKEKLGEEEEEDALFFTTRFCSDWFRLREKEKGLIIGERLFYDALWFILFEFARSNTAMDSRLR